MLRFERVRSRRDPYGKSFGEIVAVDDLSLEITSGEVFGLLGPNGAGVFHWTVE